MYGSISQPGDISQQTGILKLTKNTIDFTPSGVAEPSITITNLWTGDDVESQFVVSPNSPDVKYDVTWAFLYEGDSKIGIILHKIANERNVTAYYLGNDALVFRRDQTALDNYDFGNIGQLYTGTGESVETGSLGIELDLK